MSGKRCPFCIAKDDEITRLHRLVEKLSMRPQYVGVSGAGDSVPLTTTMQSLGVQAEEPDDDLPVGAIPLGTFMDQFNAVHGDNAWADLAGIGRAKAEE